MATAFLNPIPLTGCWVLMSSFVILCTVLYIVLKWVLLSDEPTRAEGHRVDGRHQALDCRTGDGRSPWPAASARGWREPNWGQYSPWVTVWSEGRCDGWGLYQAQCTARSLSWLFLHTGKSQNVLCRLSFCNTSNALWQRGCSKTLLIIIIRCCLRKVRLGGLYNKTP